MLIGDKPLFLCLFLFDDLGEIVRLTFICEPERVAPIIEGQLKYRLPCKLKRQVLTDFTLRNRKALDAEGEKSLRPLRKAPRCGGLRGAVAVLRVLHSAESIPSDISDGDEFLIEKVGDYLRDVLVDID